MNQPIFLAIYELAERTGLPVYWLKEEADKGRIPSIKVGRRRFFKLESVLASISSNQNQNEDVTDER